MRRKRGLCTVPGVPAAVLFVVLGLAGCGAPGPTTTTPATSGSAVTPSTSTVPSGAAPAPAPSSAVAPSSSSAPVPGPDVVVIKDFAFVPPGLTVAPGARITVRNEDTANHTLTALDQSFDSGNIPGHATATLTTPSRPGDYPYRCSIHPVMTGTLTVR